VAMTDTTATAAATAVLGNPIQCRLFIDLDPEKVKPAP